MMAWRISRKIHGSGEKFLELRKPRATCTFGSRRRYSDATEEVQLKQIPEEVDVAIVGGGVTGAAILYHLGLAQHGSSSAVFEKATLTSGATWHAAGLVTYYHGGNNFKFWHQEGVDLYTKWQNQEGIPLSFNTPGSVRLIQNEERMKEARSTLSKSKIYQGLFGGPELHLIGADEIKRLHPLVNTDGILAAVYSEGDGHIDPSSVTQAFATKAREMGGRIFEHSEVVGLQSNSDGHWTVSVKTADGHVHIVKAKCVVNCAGLWAKRIGNFAGVHTPCTVLQHQYVITEGIPEVREFHAKHGHQLPVIRDLEGSFYLRDEGDGMLIGPYESEDVMQLAPSNWKGSMPEHLTYHLFEGDIERLIDSMEIATNLVPNLEVAGIKTVLNGPTCWPADGNHLVGPSWEKPNYWDACAESYGIAHAAGLGRYMVHWMIHGEPPYELTEADPARYGAWATQSWVDEKVKEAYGWNNVIPYFNENRTRARPVTHAERPQADIVDVLRKRGAQFGFSHGWETPNWFHSSPVDLKNSMASFERPVYWDAVRKECEQVVNHGGLCYWPFAHYRISGPSASTFIDRLIANKVPAVGRVGLGHLLTPAGKVYSELTFVRLAEQDFYVTGYSNYQLHDLRWMRKHLGTNEEVKIEDITSDSAVIFLNGPNAESALSQVLDSPVEISRDHFRPFQWRKLSISGADVTAVRMSFIGEHGFELHVKRDQVARLYELFHQADPMLCDWGGSAMNSFRIEKGTPLFGKDITKDHDAFEAGLHRFVKLGKGDFIGRQALQEVQDAGGPQRRLVNMVIEDGGIPVDAAGNESIWCPESGEVVGFTTSGVWGCISGKSLAQGYIYGPERWTNGTKLHVDLLGKRRQLVVLEKPVVDPAAVRDRRK